VEEFAHALETKPPLRAVNFHSTPRTRTSEYREQLKKWGKRFSAVTEDDLDRYLATGEWQNPKPGLIIALYDASRNGYDAILPLIEEAGLIGWYFILTGFVAAPPAAQLAYAVAHDIAVQAAEYVDGRQALSWSELREIEKRGHVVASHARSHVSLRELDDSARESEVMGSQLDMKNYLGHKVRSFVSYGGPAYGDHPPSDSLIDKAGYQFVFSNLKIQRLRDWKVNAAHLPWAGSLGR
jgi:peptidoglycan/xylan/chitin deacetylase (PgdA/CDA1 family)